MSTDRPWLSIYPKGIPANIDPDKYATVLDYIKEKCEEHKKKSAYSLMGVELTFGEIDKLSTQFGGYLRSRGLEPGDRFAIMMPNLLQYPIAVIGALKAGMIVVNTNPLYTPREMKHQFTDSDVKGIIIAENFAHNLEKILPETSIKVIITTTIGEMLGSVKGSMVDFTVRTVKRMIPKFNLPNPIPYRTALKQGKGFKIQDFENKPDSVVMHQYTGGTTGLSKGAMLTNRNLIANLMQLKAISDPYVSHIDKPIVVSPLPLYHIYAFTCNCLYGNIKLQL